MPTLSGQILWLTCPLVTQLLLIARSTQSMQRWYISIKTSPMALLHKCCWYAGADISRIWTLEVVIFRTGFRSCYDCLCRNFSHKGNSIPLKESICQV